MTRHKFSLTGNQLKLIAMLSMTLDHIGLQLFPRIEIFRILGRLALPIFAYMIAEGCRYTHNRAKYLLTVFLSGAVCQLVYFFAMDSLYQCILITFTLSIFLIFFLDRMLTREDPISALLLTGALLLVWFISEELPSLLPGTDFAIDYGFFGILLPVFFYLGRTPSEKLLLGFIGLVLLALTGGPVQWYSLPTIGLLALYNGKRGKYKLKYLFYIYYPLHLVAIYGISLLLRK